MKSLNELKDDLSIVKDYEVVVFGSYADNSSDKRSDIDTAVITREQDRKKCLEIWVDVIGKAPEIYDIKIFELLPLRIQNSVIQKHEVVFGNHLDISEYFYTFRKLWNDTKHRIEENRFHNMKEKIRLLEIYRRSSRKKAVVNIQ